MVAISTRIEYAGDQPASATARWASRLAWFSVLLLVAALFLHRVLSLPTPMALNLAGTAFLIAALAVVLAAIAGLDIWVTGRQGTARVVSAVLVASVILAVPVAAWIESRKHPFLADVTTDTKNPPQFSELLERRGKDANSAVYNAERDEPLQSKGYPDLATLVVPRSADDTFDVVLQALTKLKLKPVAEQAPADTSNGVGTIELSDRTPILGFRDDVVIRVAGDETSAHVDVRSASRYGRTDFGCNAARVRLILREIVGRLEATLPSQKKAKPAAKDAKDKKTLKRPAAGDRPSAAHRPRPAPSRPEARREPGESASPPE